MVLIKLLKKKKTIVLRNKCWNLTITKEITLLKTRSYFLSIMDRKKRKTVLCNRKLIPLVDKDLTVAPFMLAKY